MQSRPYNPHAPLPRGFGGKRDRMRARRSKFAGGINIKLGKPTWLTNAVKSAGRAVGGVAKGIADESGKIGRGLGKVPIVGGLLKGLYDAALIGTPGGAEFFLTEQVIVEHKRIDKVALAALKQELKDFKEVAPYAQMVISFIPGIGPGISAAIGVGLALAEGQPLTEALMTGVEDALPGGPLAKMACEVAKQGIEMAVEHKKLDWGNLAKAGANVVEAAVNMPQEAKDLINGGITCAGALMKGQRLDKALVAGVAEGLNMAPSTKAAISTLTDVSVSIAQGQRVDKALLTHVDGLCAAIPGMSPDARKLLTTGVDVSIAAAQKKPIGQIMSTAIQHGVCDVFLDMGKKGMPDSFKKSFSIGLGTVHAQQLQAITRPILNSQVVRNLKPIGQQVIATDKVVGAAYSTIVKDGKSGYQVGVALMRHVTTPHEFATIRASLSEADKKGFDIACSLHIGRVTTPPSLKLADPHAQAGYAITHGVQGDYDAQKMAQMQAVAAAPVARVGAQVAIDKIAVDRAPFWERILYAFGLAKPELH
jgi:hypothetical protein